MPYSEPPEFVDWTKNDPPGSRFGGFIPALALSGLLFGGVGFAHCFPQRHYRVHDYYTCSPRYICKPVPYWPGVSW